jgi:hypothetical protein
MPNTFERPGESVTAWRLTSWLAGLAFLTALLQLCSIAVSIGRVGPLPDGMVTLLLKLGAAGILLYMVLRFGLWWVARGRPGSGLLLGAAVIGAVADSWLLPVLSEQSTLSVVIIYVNVSLALIAPLLLGAGLLRTRLVPPWIPTLVIVATLIKVAGLLFSGTAITALSSVLDFAFLIGLGVSLLRVEKPVAPEMNAA